MKFVNQTCLSRSKLGGRLHGKFDYRSRNRFQQVEEDHLDNMLGMPTRFSYEELKKITKNFSNKLGEDGFGSVSQGTLPSGSQVAVKHLFGIGPVNKSFGAEVQTIGSIHHFNLFNRLLVYEYMANGSLDRWIFNKNQDLSLDWQVRKKIILDIAKGLAYLHEDCNRKIIHLDIKPQNILLDENFNAKVSDFGLSKLIEKDQSQVVTSMRGTPVLEVLCGRRNIDGSQQEEDRHLLKLFGRKQEEGQLLDLVDKRVEVVEMMKVAAWCLQTDSARRPSMSAVVKLFEGSVDVVIDMDEDLLNELTPEVGESFATTVLPSMLSGPRS
ncbi:hypothetical protein GOBAR_AA35891 [Gossypium barbadense]|uniref:Protein kinase domain-containing protein n=1 Tax=Gossypium barbadense TaxID=3634 RepID=A0A2P5W145_GOSBA|nr:hypothetical protein GOBAR_AA35891 [Gossypium barbadense]